MKRKITLLLALLLLLSHQALPCTNFLVGKKASADGSTFISYAADSYYLFGALYHYPAQKYPQNAMLDIYEWDTGKYLGQIKQATETYNVIGNMNEYQVSIAETTFGGRTELIDTTAILDYGSLMYIALQRSKTAREAIQTITDLVNQYGYYSAGESFSIADPNEVWILEMVGKGTKQKGAVWVAMRIPDDCISGHANQARITTIPFDDKENCMYAPDVVSFAKEMGYYKGEDKDFSFSDTYNPLDYSGLRICEGRVWSIFQQTNPQMKKFITYIKGETKERMPLWIKPTKKISKNDMIRFMRDYYEGTSLDLTKGIAAGAYGSKLRNGPLYFTVDGVKYGHERPIATQQTGFVFVAQMRNWLPNHIGGILWFGVDDAASTVFTPVYCCTNRVPWCYDQHNGSLLEYSPTSSFWIFNQVANFAYGKYQPTMIDIRKKQKEIEEQFDIQSKRSDADAMMMDKQNAIKFLTDFSNTLATKTSYEWKKMGEFLLVKYMDGNIKQEKDGQFLKDKYGQPEKIIRAEYPEEVKQKMVKENPDLRYRTDEELKTRK